MDFNSGFHEKSQRPMGISPLAPQPAARTNSQGQEFAMNLSDKSAR